MDKQLYNFYANDKLAFFNDYVLIPDNKRGKMNKIELHKALNIYIVINRLGNVYYQLVKNTYNLPACL